MRVEHERGRKQETMNNPSRLTSRLVYLYVYILIYMYVDVGLCSSVLCIIQCGEVQFMCKNIVYLG